MAIVRILHAIYLMMWNVPEKEWLRFFYKTSKEPLLDQH